MVDGVELTVLSKSIAQIYATGFVDLPDLGLLLWVLHGLLDIFQDFGMVLMLHVAHVRMRVLEIVRQVDATLGGDFGGTSLPQVHVGEACMIPLRPGICWRLRIEVKLHIAQLADPSHQIAFGIGVPSTFTASHGDAQDVASLDLGISGQGGHLTIVDDLQWRVGPGQIFGNPLENVAQSNTKNSETIQTPESATIIGIVVFLDACFSTSCFETSGLEIPP